MPGPPKAPQALIIGVQTVLGARIAEQCCHLGMRVLGTVSDMGPYSLLLLSQSQRFLEFFAFRGMYSWEPPSQEKIHENCYDMLMRDCEILVYVPEFDLQAYNSPDEFVRELTRRMQWVLQAAKKHGATLKAFIFISSWASVYQPFTDPGHVFTSKSYSEFWHLDWMADETKQILDPSIPGIDKRRACYTSMEKVFWMFRHDNELDFTMTTLNPGVLIDPITPIFQYRVLTVPDKPLRHRLYPTLNKVISDIFLGQRLAKLRAPFWPPYVDVRNVVQGVMAMINTVYFDDKNKIDRERILMAEGYGGAQQIADILRAQFPDRGEIIDKGQPMDYPQSMRVFDCSSAKSCFKWIPLEQTVVDMSKTIMFLSRPRKN